MSQPPVVNYEAPPRLPRLKRPIFGNISLMLAIPAVVIMAIHASPWDPVHKHLISHQAFNDVLVWVTRTCCLGFIAGLVGLFHFGTDRERAIYGMFANALLTIVIPSFQYA